MAGRHIKLRCANFEGKKYGDDVEDDNEDDQDEDEEEEDDDDPLLGTLRTFS